MPKKTFWDACGYEKKGEWSKETKYVKKFQQDYYLKLLLTLSNNIHLPEIVRKKRKEQIPLDASSMLQKKYLISSYNAGSI